MPAQNTPDVLDFDQVLGEIEEKTITIKLYGEEWQIPASPPALLFLKLSRTQKTKGDEYRFTPQEIYDMCESAFGKENLREWCSRGLTEDQMTRFLLKRLGGLIEPLDGEAPKNRRSRRSSTR